jgi:type I restriction enzyme M protein
MANNNDHANFIWQIADLLRGPYRPPQYERVMLPMTVLRRFDCVLAPTKNAVLNKYENVKDKYKNEALDAILNRTAKQKFHNRSSFTFEKLKGAPNSIEQDLVSYINGFSANVRRIFDYFEFEKEIEKMHEANILYLVVSQFATIDLHPNAVPNDEMGQIFEELIRKFNEAANETAGDHFTPREVIRLMVSLLFINDDDLLATPGTIRKMLDPTCGTGGMLAEAQKYLREHHPEANLYAYGQDYNKRAYATAASDMLIKEVSHNGSGENIRYGDTLIDDQFEGETFDYLIANPPFGVDWKKQQQEIKKEYNNLGYTGRFGAGLPRVNDGSLLFLQHMIKKFEPVDVKTHRYGSRLAIVFSGSPLFTGGAGSGESNIRRWIIESDWLETVIALPEQMFYNTGIGTYIWIVTNKKEKRRKEKIQLIDARELYVPLRRNLGDKRRKIGEGENGEPDQISEIVKLYGNFQETEKSKIFDNADFGFTRVTVERPLRLKYQMSIERKAIFLDELPHLLKDIQTIDKALGREAILDWNEVNKKVNQILKTNDSKWKAKEKKFFREVFTERSTNAAPVQKNKEKFEPDSKLRDYENIALNEGNYLDDKVPLKDNIKAYFKREVLPHVPDAWMDRSKDKIGYEINFNRYFYKFRSLRSLTEIDNDLKKVEKEILDLLNDIT